MIRLAPEVIQTSSMDCGPAALKSILEGFGIPTSYGRLREACQTDVDGTSIDALEDVAQQLGLRAEQIMMPPDHLLLDEAEALPAILVVQLLGGPTHFEVVWRRHGSRVQVMDPASGRRWQPARQFLKHIYVHETAVPASRWREWAGSDGFLLPLQRRLRDIAVRAEGLVAQARVDSGWHALATLDAATRMTAELLQVGAITRSMTGDLVAACCERPQAIPPRHFMVTAGELDQLRVRGAVLLRVLGRRPQTEAPPAPLSPELVAALEEPPARPGRELWRLLREDGFWAPGAILLALLLATAAVGFEALLLRGLLDVSHHLGLVSQRVTAVGVLVTFVVLLLLLELPIASSLQRLGRRLDARLRVAFLSKVPRLGDRYFRSRPSSDMASRSHSVHMLRQLPQVGGQLLRSGFELVVTTCGIAWLDPHLALVAAFVATLAIAVPAVMQSPIIERDMRVRVHSGSLAGFYLDAILGLMAVRTHAAEAALRREHEGLLFEWARASRRLLSAQVVVEGLQLAFGFGLAAWLLYAHVARAGEAGATLLLVYWALNLPALGQDIAIALRQYPMHRNHTLRLLEPLGARDEDAPLGTAVSDAIGGDAAEGVRFARGVSVELRGVAVRAGGHTILEDINLGIPAGAHVAVVGPSGAGKSSLLGLLLGWHRAIRGSVHVDGQPLEGSLLALLRRQTAWVDPQVQLWNRSFLDNLRYGAPPEAPLAVGRAIEDADLRDLVASLPDGLQTRLGEGGGLVSGGEGQRVRLGRALLRPAVRLAILDEPFRGLDRERRRTLLARTRERFAQATLICVTHDVGETQVFDRVIVIEGGRIVEDGAPDALAGRPGSRYAAMLEAEENVRKRLWHGEGWRRQRLSGGVVEEDA